MKTLKEFFVAVVLFGLTVAGCGSDASILSDLGQAAPERSRILSLVAKGAQYGICTQDDYLDSRMASYQPMIQIERGGPDYTEDQLLMMTDQQNWGEDTDNPSVSFWLSEMKTEVTPEADPPAGTIQYAFVYVESSNKFLVGLIRISYEWNGETWTGIGTQVQCSLDVSGAIQGSVVNGITGAPLEGARVYAESDSGFRSPVARVDSEGGFTVFAVVPGRITLRAFAPGFEEALVEGIEAGSGEVVHNDEPIVMIPLTTQTFITVTGRITFSDGETPYLGIDVFGREYPVAVYLENAEGGSSGLAGMMDFEGWYRIPFVTPGQYQLRFSCQGLSTFVDSWEREWNYYLVNIAEGDGPMVEVKDLMADTLPPIVQGIESSVATIGPGQSATITVAAGDPDGDILNYSWRASGGIVSLSDGNAIEWTAPDAPGTYTIDVIVNDGKGGADSGSVEITVDESK